MLRGVNTSLLEKHKHFNCCFAVCHVATFAKGREDGQSFVGRIVVLGDPLGILGCLHISDTGDVVTDLGG